MQPVRFFQHYLTNLDGMLVKAAQVSGGVQQEQALLSLTLADDMFPLYQQVQTAIHFSLRIVFPLDSQFIPDQADYDYSLEGLRQQIANSLTQIKTLQLDSNERWHDRSVTTTAGFAECQFSGIDYFSLYGVPNFLFHMGMVYALLKQAGVVLGKQDFDGFHCYPNGFTFL